MTEPAPQLEQSFFPSSIHPGDLTDQLRKCREKAGLDLEQAAEELHLSPHILKALEAEDFARLPEPPYVRGYLRGYAKLADADSKELIRIYEALRGANPDEMAKHFAPARPLHKVTQPMLSATTLKFIGFGALVLLLGLLSMIPGVRDWASHTWGSFAAQSKPQDTAARPPSALEAYALQKAEREQEKNRQDSLAQQAAQTPVPTAATTPAAADTSTTAAAVTAPATPAAADTSTTTAAATTPAAADASTTAAAATTPATPAAADTSTTAAAATTPATTTTTAMSAPATGDTTVTTATPAGEPQPTGTPVTIKMEFSEEVWAQIKGIDKKVLYEALNTPNTIKEFQVAPPVDIKLGNAPGAKVFINGQPFDTTPYTKGSVARFNVE